LPLRFPHGANFYIVVVQEERITFLSKKDMYIFGCKKKKKKKSYSRRGTKEPSTHGISLADDW
jgi:hypothetical protein